MRQSASFPTFFSALGATPNTKYVSGIVDALKLGTTLSNPKLALTVFMPEDKVRCSSVEAAYTNRIGMQDAAPGWPRRRCVRGSVWAAAAVNGRCARRAVRSRAPGVLAGLSPAPKPSRARLRQAPRSARHLPAHPTLTPLRLTKTPPQYFDALAVKLGVAPGGMSKNAALMKQVLFYHFVTGSNGVKRTFSTASLKPLMKLDTMYMSTSTKKPYQLAVSAVNGKLQIRSVGTSAYIIKSNIRCGAGYAHIINNVLIPMPLSQIPKF